MFIEKIIIITSVLLVFSGAVLAQGASQSYRSKVKFEYGPAFEAIDTNKDGKILKDEWMAAGLSQHTYEHMFTIMLDVDKGLPVTKEEFAASSPQFEVDTNKDGKVSFEEYAAANNGRAALMTSGGASAPPPTNHGGAAGGAPQGGSTSAEQK